MAPPTGFEPATTGFGNRNSVRLSYRGMLWAWRDSNPRPTNYEFAALPTKLQARLLKYTCEFMISQGAHVWHRTRVPNPLQLDSLYRTELHGLNLVPLSGLEPESCANLALIQLIRLALYPLELQRHWWDRGGFEPPSFGLKGRTLPVELRSQCSVNPLASFQTISSKARTLVGRQGLEP